MTDAEVSAQCVALQEQELEVLQAIYPQAVRIVSPREMKLEVPVDLGSTVSVRVVYLTGAAAAGAASVQLSHLPPLLLSFKLPASYPMTSPPTLESVYSTHDWLAVTAAAEAKERLCAMWSPGEEGVLDAWVEWIRSGQMLHDLGLQCGEEILIRHPAPHLLTPRLVEYDTSIASEEFANTAYTCAICMTSLKGARCVRLSCSHVFCHSCLKDYWTLSITEGNVAAVGCAEPECVKRGVEAKAEEVRRVVADELVDRWHWLLLKREADRDPTIIACPMQTCQRPVPRTQGMDEDATGWSRFRQCQSCGFSFCSFCKRTWHGPVAACAANTSLAIVTEYMALPEGSPESRLMEVRYGKRNLQRLVAAYKEEQANKQYFEMSTRACPGCSTKIQKSMGCNHMTCARCGTHFCYLCSEKLLAANPYLHFSTMGRGCYNKLFDEADIRTNEEVPVQAFDNGFVDLWQ
ncbi:hypothetical protein AURDEDRAFT_78542 [Auricularia subglabra TFB-10046 SS5]|nr:hypothetical protein AURDEDRAFT_78542 [Auricularia subglabra TFB-10046 SS5]